MGSVARTGIPGFIIGNAAESILGQVKCSVLVVKPDGLISPVIENKLSMLSVIFVIFIHHTLRHLNQRKI